MCHVSAFISKQPLHPHGDADLPTIGRGMLIVSKAFQKLCYER